MPRLLRQPGRDGLPACWILRLREDDADEAAHAALETLLPPEDLDSAEFPLDPESAAKRVRFERRASGPVMTVHATPEGDLRIELDRTAAKGLVELWELVAQGAGEYSFEVLDATEDPAYPVKTYLTLEREGV